MFLNNFGNYHCESVGFNDIAYAFFDHQTILDHCPAHCSELCSKRILIMFLNQIVPFALRLQYIFDSSY